MGRNMRGTPRLRGNEAAAEHKTRPIATSELTCSLRNTRQLGIMRSDIAVWRRHDLKAGTVAPAWPVMRLWPGRRCG
jgi:hypothetical protein